MLQAGYRYALALCHHRADAEDLVQGAWLRLREAGRADGAGVPLLFTAIRNLFKDRRRREKLVAFEPLDDAPEVADNGADAAAGVLAARDLEAPLAALCVAEREALFLLVVEGYTAREAAELTGRPRGTVSSLAHRAKEKLRRALADGAEAGNNAADKEGRCRISTN